MSRHITRRGLVTGAGAWAAMSALARRGQAQESSRPVSVRGTARTCVFINLLGAPSHVDTFDLKDGPWIPPDKDL
ncbi:MAG: hypothetical protein HY013_04100, partial [Candidatus Solibacter usitatus]|nr:hypothetical protein [Candidatus Solibacter usitatus]